ncbi:MAG: flagellar hook-associated protein FlgK [Alphaproteobacteria bacterium]
MALSSGLQVSLSGMQTAQAQLELVGQNISNANNPEYSRKTAATQSVVLAGSNAGVKLGDVDREFSESLLKSYLISSSLEGSLSSQSKYLNNAETLLGTPESANSISTNVANLQTAFGTLSIDVTSAAARSNLVNEAKTVTSRLNYLTEEIQKLRGDADLEISDAIDTINSTLSTIDKLNEEVVKGNILGYDGTADLLDQRDAAIKELSSLMDVTYFTRNNGEIVIQTTDGVTLLDSEPNYLSHSAITQASPSASYASGAIDGIFVEGVDITSKIKEGQIAGLIEVRDEILPSLQSQLDELTGVLKTAVNAAHNTGTAFPAGAYELTGTRTFISPDTQNIAISNGDVRISVFDTEGNQINTTALSGNLGFSNGSITEMANTIENWLTTEVGLPQANVSVEDGKFKVETGDSNYFISFLDVENSTPGSIQQNASISFDVGNNTTREFEGFSSFLGLNDFFVNSNNQEYIYDSNVISKSTSLGIAPSSIVNLSFYNANGSMGSISLNSASSLTDIVNQVNDMDTTLIASLVPNGSEYVLRIENTSGEQIEITDGGSGLLNKLGMKPSYVTAASDIQIRNDISQNSYKMALGKPQFNNSTGTYELNAADNGVANMLSEVFSNTQSFNQAGELASTQTTLNKYSSNFVGAIATQSANLESELSYQSELTTSISGKEAEISGVDIDEELSQLIVYQQSYAACAQAFTATKEMLDTLFGIMN